MSTRLSDKIITKLPIFVVLFLTVFWIFYPYHQLIDDSRFQGILEHRYLTYDQLIRPLHMLLLWIQGGFTGGSMPAAVVVGIFFHVLLGFFTWKLLIPRLPETTRVPAILGLTAFMVHPVSLQTVVHVAQRAEILGALSLCLGILPAMYFIPGIIVRTGKKNKTRFPNTSDFFAVTFAALIAVVSKENFVVPLLVVCAALSWLRRTREGWPWVGAIILITLGGAMANNFSKDLIQNLANYRRSSAFRQSFVQEKIISPEDSILLPIRDRGENLRLQTALLPLVLKTVFVPYAFSKDYGFFPYGKKTEDPYSTWFILGCAILLAALGTGIALRARLSVVSAALILSPGFIYCAYWLFPVYDPLLPYRLYGVVFSFLVLTVPLLLSLVPESARRVVPWVLAAVIISAGTVRAWEMSDRVREANADLARVPSNYRLYLDRMAALVATKSYPIDCRSELEPALKLTPTPASIYINWAWCAREQGRIEEGSTMARLSLQYEGVPENVKLAMGYMSGPDGMTFDPKKVHPENLKLMMGK